MGGGRKAKTSWVECGASRVKEEGGGAESIALFTAHYQRAKLFCQLNDWDLSFQPRL